MAVIGNTAEMTASDGATTYFNVDTLNKVISFNNAIVAYGQSATAPAVATSGTINTAGLSVSRVSPAGAVTGVILQAGTQAGQEVTVINEAVAANSVTFAAAPGGNVADGASDVIAGLNARTFIWDAGTSLWYPMK